MNPIDRLLIELHLRQSFRPASSEWHSTPDFRAKDPTLLPSDFALFIDRTRNEMFSYWNLVFHIFNGLSEMSVNEEFADRPWEHTRRDEYEESFTFAISTEYPMYLGLELCAEKWGWIFYYCDTGHGIDDCSGYIFRSVREFLQTLLDGDTSAITPFAPMIQPRKGTPLSSNETNVGK